MTDEEIKKKLGSALGTKTLPGAVWETLEEDYAPDLGRARELREPKGEPWEDIVEDAKYAWRAIRRGMTAAREEALFGGVGTGAPKRRLRVAKGVDLSESRTDFGYEELWKDLTPKGDGEEREHAAALSDYMALCASLNPGVREFRRKVLGGDILSPGEAHEFADSLANRWFGEEDFEVWGTTPVGHRAVPVPGYFPDFDTGGECVILESLGKQIFLSDDEMEERFAGYFYFPSRGEDFFGNPKLDFSHYAA